MRAVLVTLLLLLTLPLFANEGKLEMQCGNLTTPAGGSWSAASLESRPVYSCVVGERTYCVSEDRHTGRLSADAGRDFARAYAGSVAMGEPRHLKVQPSDRPFPGNSWRISFDGEVQHEPRSVEAVYGGGPNGTVLLYLVGPQVEAADLDAYADGFQPAPPADPFELYLWACLSICVGSLLIGGVVNTFAGHPAFNGACLGLVVQFLAMLGMAAYSLLGPGEIWDRLDRVGEAVGCAFIPLVVLWFFERGYQKRRKKYLEKLIDDSY